MKGSPAGTIKRYRAGNRSPAKAYAVQGVDTYGLELAHLYAEQNPRALEICNFILKRVRQNTD
jgi:hypothetical protein